MCAEGVGGIGLWEQGECGNRNYDRSMRVSTLQCLNIAGKSPVSCSHPARLMQGKGAPSQAARDATYAILGGNYITAPSCIWPQRC